MASVTVYSIAKMEELLDAGVVGATITDGELILTKRDGTTVNAGEVGQDIPAATDAVAGVVELATDDETNTGTDTTRAVTPFGLAARLASVTTAINGKQAADQDLTDIAAITGKTIGDVIGYQSGGWTRRTLAQLAGDLAGTGEFAETYLHNGTSYADADSTRIYIGPTDPGAVPNGSVWYDTTGA